MKLLFVILYLLFISTGIEAKKCTGKTPCLECKNCTTCKYCLQVDKNCGTCQVGKPERKKKEVDTVVVKKKKKS